GHRHSRHPPKLEELQRLGAPQVLDDESPQRGRPCPRGSRRRGQGPCRDPPASKDTQSRGNPQARYVSPPHLRNPPLGATTTNGHSWGIGTHGEVDLSSPREPQERKRHRLLQNIRWPRKTHEKAITDECLPSVNDRQALAEFLNELRRADCFAMR